MADGAKRLAAALARGRQASEKLKQETELLNKALADAEDAIASLQLGVHGVVKLYDHPDGSDWAAWLGFGKIDKKWRLTLETGDPGDEQMEITPLANASRETRLLAIHHLHELVDALIRSAEVEAAEVAEASEKAKQFVVDMASALDAQKPKARGNTAPVNEPSAGTVTDLMGALKDSLAKADKK